MPKNTVCLVAEDVVRDAETNRISVFAILDQIGCEGFPFFLSNFSVLALWRRESDDDNQIEIGFRIKNNDSEIHYSPVTLDFTESDINRTIVSIRGLLVDTPTTSLTFEFVRDTDVIGSYEVIVKATEPIATEPKAGIEPPSRPTEP